ncbi:MAG: TonB family protein [Paracoccaceae bacterium]
MRRLVEFLAFTGLGVAAHLAVLAYEPARGSDAAGSGGEAVVTLAAAPQEIDAVLRAWMQPPEAETAVDAAFEPVEPAPQALPDRPSLALDAAPRAPVRVGAMAIPDLPRAPKPDTEPPEPRAKPDKPARRPPPPSEAAVQKAAGAGRAGQAGQAASARVKTLSGGQRARLISVWGARLRSGIEHRKRYPRGARGSGVVRVRIEVARSGQLLSSRVVASSGAATFDAAALSAIARAAPFPAAPERLTDRSYAFVLNMQFDR